MIIEVIIGIVALVALAGLAYYLIKRKKGGDYIWVGHGEDPFKKED